MALLTVINNAFDINDKFTSEIENKNIYNIIPQYIKKDYDFVFSVNGIIVENLGYKLQENDHLCIVPIPAGGGGGKNILRTVAMIALVVSAPYIGGYLATGTFAVTTGITASLYTAGVMIAGGLLINSLMPINPQSTALSSDLETASPTYAFTGGSNARAEGTALPIVLGKAKIVPPIISSYLSLEDDEQHLNMLMVLNDGIFDRVHNIYVNDQNYEDYENVTYDVRYGYNEQSVMPNFSDEVTTYAKNISLNDTITIANYTTTSNAVNRLQICMTLPKGLFHIQDNGDYEDYSIEFRIKYRKVGDINWKYATNRSVTSYKYVYQDIDTDTCGPLGTDCTYLTYEYDDYKGTSYKGASFVNKYAVATTLETTSLISETYKTTKRLIYGISRLSSGQYEIQIDRVSSYNTDTRYANDLLFEYINEITYDDLSYPNTGLLGINAMATDQLSGSFPIVSAIVENKYLRYWENDNFYSDTTKLLSNPAWACYYMLKRAEFGDSYINLSEFQIWADFCDSKGYTCNLVIDQVMDLPTVLNMISALGRAKLVQMGTKWSPIIDKVVSVPTQSFLFTSGNILDGTFNLDYISYTDRANVVEVTYYDETKNYQATTIQAQAFNFDASTDEVKTNITYYGCTNKQMASNYAQFLINQNRYISETVSFNVNIDALACNVGDVIKVGKQYMTNNIGDGRLKTINSLTEVVLDQEVTFEVGKSYQIDIRKSDDDIIYTIDLVNPATTTDTITFSSNTIIFNELDVFTVGETGYQSNLYRVVSISRNSDFTRKISAVEYIAEVYDDTLLVPEQIEKNINPITNLTATDVLVKEKDGSIGEYLNISWQGGLYLTIDVLIDGIKVGNTYKNDFLWLNPTRGKTYTITVGEATLSHLYQGIDIAPDPIINLTGSENGNKFSLSWEYNKPIDFKYFKITDNRANKEFFTTDLNYTTPIINGLGTHILTVYAVDVLDNLSTGVSINLVATAPNDITTINSIDNLEQVILDWEYVKPTDFKQFQISVNNKTYFTEDTYFEYPFISDKVIFNVVVEDTGGNKSGGQTVIYEKGYATDITGLTTYFEGNQIAFTWDRDENINYKYIIKKGTSWSAGAIVKETTEEKFYPQSTGEYSIKKTYTNAYGVVFESQNPVAFSVEGDLSLQTNVVAEFNERTDGWNGTKTNVVIVDSTDSTYDGALSTASAITVDEIPNWDGVPDLDAYTTVPYGIYEASNVLTLSSAQVVAIAIDTQFLAKDTENLMDYWTSFDGIADIDGQISKLFKINRQISISQDGIVYGDWKNFQNGNYIGKSFKFRVEFYSYDDSVIPYLQQFIIHADMEDRLDRGSLTTLSSGYYTLNHTPVFNAVPKTICTIIDAQDGDNLILTNETVNGFDVKVRNSGSDVIRTINYISQGY